MADGQSIGGGMNFGWMSNPALMDPGMQMAMMRQQYAQGLMNQGMDTSPIRSPWQAVARGVQGLLGGIGMNSAFNAMQDYATGSRKALAESYAQQPIPQLPQVGGQGGGGAPGGSSVLPPQPGGVTLAPTQSGPAGGGGAAPLQPAGGASGSIDPAALLPKQQALQAVVDRESGGQNIISKIPLTQDQINKGYTDLSKGSGLFQIIPTTWAHGQQLAGIPADQRTQYAIQADPAVQWKVASALYDESGLANWRQSANTSYVNPNSVQPGSGSYGAIQQASQAAADYGVQMAQQYRQMAINAAQSPYAAVRALAPHYQEQSVGYLQYGRFSPVGMDQNGQIQMIDRLSGEVKTVGAPVQLHELPQGGLGTSGGQTVYGPGYSTVPGSGGVGGPGGGAGGSGGGGGGTTPYVGNPATSRAFGVPTSPSNPYAGLPVKDQQTAWNKDRTDASGRADATDGEADAAKTQLLSLQRMQQIAATNPGWLGTGPAAAALRLKAETFNDPLYQEFQTLQKGLIPAERMGAGISRVTNKDMSIFENMAPNAEMDGTALNNTLQAHIRLATLTQQSNRFMHDFVNANGTDRGAQNAWDAYMRANPIFNQDPKTGVYSPNQNYTPYQDWFRAHTDPNTGQLVQPSPTQPPPAQPTQTPQNPPTHQTVTTQGDALPPVGPARTIIHDPATGRTFMSDGTRWNPIQVPK